MESYKDTVIPIHLECENDNCTKANSYNDDIQDIEEQQICDNADDERRHSATDDGESHKFTESHCEKERSTSLPKKVMLCFMCVTAVMALLKAGTSILWLVSNRRDVTADQVANVEINNIHSVNENYMHNAWERRTRKTPQRQDEREICDITLNKPCKEGLTCVKSMTSVSTGICMRDDEVSFGRITAVSYEVNIPRRQEKREICDVTLGDKACQVGLSCVVTGKSDPLRPGVGICLEEDEYSIETLTSSVHVAKRQDEGEVCLLKMGKKACQSGYTCVPSKNSDEVGLCVMDSAEPQRTRKSVLPKGQKEGEFCNIAFGVQACKGDLYCLGGTSNEAGVCTKYSRIASMTVPKKQQKGEICDNTYGRKACVNGHSCVVRGGASVLNIGICKEDIGLKLAPANTEWWVRWSTNECVRSCEIGTGDNCGGVKPSWDTSRYTTAGQCCGKELLWKSVEVCVPSHRSL